MTGLIVFEKIPVWEPKAQSFDLPYDERSIFIHVTVSTTEPFLAEGTKVTAHAFGSIGTGSVESGFDNVSVLYANILDVCVLFNGAYQVVGGQILLGSNPAGVCLLVTHTRPSESYNLTEWKEFGPGAFLSADDQTIQWQGPIESVPSVLIQYTDFLTIDGVLHNSMSKDFPAKNLHIESSANLDLYKIEAKGLAVAIIMAIIGLPFLPSLITELRQPKTQKVNRSRARRSQRRIQRKKPHTQAPNTKKPRS